MHIIRHENPVSLLLVLFSGLSLAQTYPNKPVRLIIPFPPGGSNDVVGRAIGQQLAERLVTTAI